jgi:hypothetical protein
MKLIIAGNRDRHVSDKFIDHWLAMYHLEPIAILTGRAKGIDSCGEQWATNKGITVIRFPANWNSYGKAAGPIRNRAMAKEADALLAFWDGKSRGTKNMIEEMKMLSKQVYVVKLEAA